MRSTARRGEWVEAAGFEGAGRVRLGAVGTDEEPVADEEDVGLDAVEAVAERVEKRVRVLSGAATRKKPAPVGRASAG
ncbi:hypothetical protein BIV23_06955 [Streptomyces monashensis]|uniref:Uncharacterized protein n=1 Tax=Streptomyces monashensis TaxID=1678012 RepID=A0A1S2QKM2_9ACTN|nr:hypothetical protein BIV23_06955 [Streptomyces monashensis]